MNVSADAAAKLGHAILVCERVCGSRARAGFCQSSLVAATSTTAASALDALRKTSLTEEQARLVSRLAETLEPPRPAGPDAAQIYMVPARVAGGAIVRELSLIHI